MNELPFGAGIDVQKNIPDERRTVADTESAGAPGTPIYGGYILEDEQDAALTGINKYRTYSDLLVNVSIVGAGVRYFQNLVSRPSWRAQAANESSEAKRYAELVEDMFDDMETPMQRVVKRGSMYKFWGFSVQEIVAKVRPDGVIGIRDIAPRAQRTIVRWDRDLDHGHILGVAQDNPQTGRSQYIPRSKMLYMVDDSLHDSPEGLGLFRHIAEPCRRLKRLEQLEGWGYETDLRGVPIGRAPLEELAKMSKQEQDKYLKSIRAFMKSHIRGNNLSLLLDSRTYITDDEAGRPSNVPKWSVELLKASANSQSDVLNSIDRVNREIARCIGVEQLLLGDNGVGSFAMAKDKSHNFALIIDGTLDEMRSAFFNDVVTFIFRVNGWPMELRPKLKADKLQTRTVDEVTGALRDMAQAGAILAPDDPAVNAVRDIIGLPDADLEQAALDAALLQEQQLETQNQQSNDSLDQ